MRAARAGLVQGLYFSDEQNLMGPAQAPNVSPKWAKGASGKAASQLC